MINIIYILYVEMHIRKQFKYEQAHIVREAWSERCSKNIHGHSYLLEIILEGTDLDAGHMALDFGLVKLWGNDFFDSFDHSFMLWNRPCDAHITKFSIENFERVIVTPFSSSAEIQATMFGVVFNSILESWKAKENQYSQHIPKNVRLKKAIVHETKTGYAEFDIDHDKHLIPTVNFPIRIFGKDEADKVLSEPNYIRISE